MAKVNVKAKDTRLDETARLAGGFGQAAARQNAEALLRRAVLACLLWEDMYYESGKAGAENIASLIPLVDPRKVYDIAVEARLQQKLRHVPLYIAYEMTKHETHRGLVASLLPKIIQRADELTEYVAIYWKDGKHPFSAGSKKGLAEAFHNFGAYALSKYNRDSAVKLRDVLFMVHPKPKDREQEALWKSLVDGTLQPPDTWEVALSGGADKCETWTRLIQENKLGALAFLRNLRNMEQVKVSPDVIRKGFEQVNARWLLPVNYLAAAKASPRYEKEVETLMLRGFSQMPKLPGYTVFVVDVSGSMGSAISGKSELSRMEVAEAMAMMAASVCERAAIYATAGSDGGQYHLTELLPVRYGFAMMDTINQARRRLGGGGIFTRQCLEYIKAQESEKPDRIIIFSDSQDCDHKNKVPAPFGAHNYIVDVSAHARGINYKGVWDAEISGWSEHFLTYIAALEGVNWNTEAEQVIEA